MKSILAILLLVSPSAFAGTCMVSSKYSELERGINKDTICKETLGAITGSYTFEDDHRLVIEAKGQRQMYSVELTKIKLFVKGRRVFLGSGTLHWYPGDSYVDLD